MARPGGKTRRGAAAVALALALVVPACSGGDDGGGGEGASSATTTGSGAGGWVPVPLPDEVETLGGSMDFEPAALAGCEVPLASRCLLPFPDDRFTRDDPSTPTGRRLDLPPAVMPTNAQGTPIDPTEWNRSDGFSPGSLVVVTVDDLDLEASELPGATDIGASVDGDSPLVLLDAETGERWPAWAELDQGQVGEEEASPPEGGDQALLIRPARALTEGHRYVVALRDLRGTEGQPLGAPGPFVAYRDLMGTNMPGIEAERPRMERLLRELEQAGVARDESLHIAWDFTVASQEGLSGRLLSMRDQAFEQLGDDVPAFTVTAGEGGPGTTIPVDGPPSRVVEGTFEVPLFLTDGGVPGSVLANEGDPDGIPSVQGTFTASFTCVVPVDPDEPGQTVVYGHGLLGSRDEVRGLGTAAAGESDATACATDWIGMSGEDVPAVAAMIGDFSDFRQLPDRLQQAHVNMLFLGRLLDDPRGFASHPAFQQVTGEPVLEPGRVGFLGASQGGILGGATTAVATDWSRAVLAVPAQNYSTLLDRSIDFDEFDLLLAAAYPSALDRQLVLSLAQILWDRGENQGYSQHLTTDPLPGTPEVKQVLIVASFGDHQVANVGTDLLARSAGIPVRQPMLADGRSTDVDPFWGLEAVPSWPHGGSAYVMWDFGTPSPPTTNTPPREGDDPHGKPGLVPEVRELIVTFLDTGEVDDPCPAGEPCRADV